MVCNLDMNEEVLPAGLCPMIEERKSEMHV